MPSRFILIAMLASTLAGAPEAAAQAGDLLQRIRNRIEQVPGATVAVAYRELPDGSALLLNPDTVFHAASTMKIPVLIEYFRAIDQGRIRPEQELLLSVEFRSIVDGSPYTLGADVDSDSSVFERVGHFVPLRWLADRMIVRSSNLATNALIDVLDAKRVDETARALGTTHTRVLRGVEDGKAFAQGLNNVTTARDLATLLEAIETGRAASRASCDTMIGILSRQEFNELIPAGLPPGTRVAHKTGWITGISHDAALVYPPGRKPYVLVVLTRGIADTRVANELVADISRIVWKASR